MERTAFVMRHYEGMGIEQISIALGVQAGAAKHSVFPLPRSSEEHWSQLSAEAE